MPIASEARRNLRMNVRVADSWGITGFGAEDYLKRFTRDSIPLPLHG